MTQQTRLIEQMRVRITQQSLLKQNMVVVALMSSAATPEPLKKVRKPSVFEGFFLTVAVQPLLEPHKVNLYSVDKKT